MKIENFIIQADKRLSQISIGFTKLVTPIIIIPIPRILSNCHTDTTFSLTINNHINNNECIYLRSIEIKIKLAAMNKWIAIKC